MTISHPTLAALALLVLATSCAESVGVNNNTVGKSGGSSSRGGTTASSSSGGSTTTTSPDSGGTTTTVESGGTTGTTLGSGGTTTTTTTTSGDCTAGTGDVTIKHEAQTGGTMIGGRTTITPSATASFDASKVVLKFCFSIMGTTAATVSAKDITIYDAYIQAAQYLSLKSTVSDIESSTDGRYCLVFDVSTVTASAGITISGTYSIGYDWRFETKNLGSGNMLDPTPGKEPGLLVSIDGTLAACKTVASY